MKNKPFCFRCGEEPQYQIELNIREGERGKARGPFWLLCGPCIRAIPWAEVFTQTLEGYEERDLEARAEADMDRADREREI